MLIRSRESKSDYVLTAFLLSFAVIFVAELGDKSQLMALAFATRYQAVPVLIGITLATALVARRLGGGRRRARCGDADRAINFVAGLSFVAFGLWTLRGDRLTEEEEQRAARPARNTVLAVGGVFFLAELGDKTMLATITLATKRACSAHGSARRSGWSPPMRWRSSSGAARDAVAGAGDQDRRRHHVLRLRRRAVRRGVLNPQHVT